MSTIIRLAPYAYLSRRGVGSTVYDLLLLVPVDATGDTDLTNVNPVKPIGETRIRIQYTTNGNPATAPYRFKHWVIDSGTYLDIEIKGDNDPDRTTLLTFLEADTEVATVVNDQQTYAPYLFLKKETVSNIEKYAHPSCIVLFEGNAGIQFETMLLDPLGCVITLTPGINNANADPTKFTINQNLKFPIVMNALYTFDGIVAGYAAENKPPRKNKRKVLW